MRIRGDGKSLELCEQTPAEVGGNLGNTAASSNEPHPAELIERGFKTHPVLNATGSVLLLTNFLSHIF